MTYPAIEKNDTYNEKIKSVIAALMKIKEIRGQLAHLLNDPDISIEFYESPKGLLMRNGGAATDPSKNWFGDGMSFRINFNEADVREIVQCELNEDVTLKEIIAHELGHVYYIWFVNKNAAPGDKGNQALAVQWEAHARGTPKQVRKHNMSAKCRGIKGTPAMR